MDTVMEKKYTLRALKASDFFLVTRILSKIGVKEFKRCFESEEIKAAVQNMMKNEGREADVASIGMAVVFDIASVVLENIGHCEADIYKLLACLADMTEKDIKNLPMVDFAEMVIDVVKHEDFRDFFTAVIKRFK